MGEHRYPAPLRALGLAARALSRAVDSAPWVALAFACSVLAVGGCVFAGVERRIEKRERECWGRGGR